MRRMNRLQIATHTARRTFVVHALEMGWSPQLVMSYTGHEDYDSLKPYIALTCALPPKIEHLIAIEN